MKKSIFLAAAIAFMLTGCGFFNNENKIEIEQYAEVANGKYSCETLLEGGSGKATIASPADVTVEAGTNYLTVEWSSPNYDYMLVNDVRYDNESETGADSVFTIPFEHFDESFMVVADTTAMSTPHEITYEITVYSPGNKGEGNAESGQDTASIDVANTKLELGPLKYVDSLQLSHAKEFSVDYYDYEGTRCELITIGSGQSVQYFLLGAEDVDGLSNNVTVLKDVDRTYLVSTSVMDLISKIDAMDYIRLSGTDEKNWYVKAAKSAMKKGNILFAGKYSMPDYELLLTEGCNLAIENTMIYHNPEVKEKLEELGIPVMVERSSYEKDPLGRLEWIKLYGILYGKEAEAKDYFDNQVARIEAIDSAKESGKKVAFFSIASNGQIIVRIPGDYISTMIDMAGGEYVPSNIKPEEDNALSTMKITFEDFYLEAVDADVLIYNSTIEGELSSVTELVSRASALADFKAIKTNNVYCLSKEYFQKSGDVAEFIEDTHNILIENKSDLKFIYKLEE